MNILLVTMLAVSCGSLTLQATALAHLLRQRAGYTAERLAGRGMVRSAATRTALACVYTASAALALAGARIPGGGVLGPEALVILIAAQSAWLYNAAMDVRIRHRLRDHTHPELREVLSVTAAHESTQESGSEVAADVHTEHEDHPWTVEIPDHPRRTDSPEYVASRARMNAIAREASGSADGLLYGAPPYQDHHGAGLWLKDAGGWFLVRGLAGIEWSGQFATEPQKVDALRRNARRLYAGFPGVAEELGIRELLDTPITSHEDVARWTDSICNASVPLPAGMHTGVPSQAHPEGGAHHFPAPITELQFTKRDDFNLWVTDAEGHPAAVAPVAHRGSGDGRVMVIYAHPGSALHREHQEHAAAGKAHVLDGGHGLARQAFSQQAPTGRAA